MIVLPNPHCINYTFLNKRLGECTFWTWELVYLFPGNIRRESLLNKWEPSSVAVQTLNDAVMIFDHTWVFTVRCCGKYNKPGSKKTTTTQIVIAWSCECRNFPTENFLGTREWLLHNTTGAVYRNTLFSLDIAFARNTMATGLLTLRNFC